MSISIVSDDPKTRLRALLAENKTRIEIMGILRINKNQLAGAIFRLNKPEKKTARKPIPAAIVPPVAVSATPVNELRAPVAGAVHVIPAHPRPPVPSESSSHTCQYPMWGYGRPTHKYCGAAVARAPYCSTHFDVCHEPLRQPQRIPGGGFEIGAGGKGGRPQVEDLGEIS